MKKEIIIFCIGLFLASTLCYLANDYRKLKSRYSDARNNIKAYEELYDSTKNQNRQFALTIDELNYSHDSLVRALNEVRKENKILDKKVKSLS